MPEVEKALISVADKTGLKDLAKGLAEFGVQIEATSGTYHYLTKEGVKSSQLWRIPSPEYLGGKIKTLNPKIFMAILADRDSKKEMQELKRKKIEPFDLVVVNLYTDKIDVGGYALLRASAKNYLYVVPLCDPDDYQTVLAEMIKNNGQVSEQTSYFMAVKTLKYLERSDRQTVRLLGVK